MIATGLIVVFLTGWFVRLITYPGERITCEQYENVRARGERFKNIDKREHFYHNHVPGFWSKK